MSSLASKNKLVSLGQVKYLLRIKPVWLSDIVAKMCLFLLGIHKINVIYERAYSKSAVTFIKSILKLQHISIKSNKNELKHVPNKGACVVVCNHPFGVIDGIILLKKLLNIRKDCKIMANFLLSEVKPLRKHFIRINPFDRKYVFSNFSGTKEALKHLNQGGLVVIFPAGEVSSYQRKRKHITDLDWSPLIANLIIKSKSIVVPAYIHGRNRLFFCFAKYIHPKLQTALLGIEFNALKRKTIRIRFGKAVNCHLKNTSISKHKFIHLLRARTYLLGSKLTPSKTNVQKLGSPKALAKHSSKKRIEHEVANEKRS